MLGAKLWDTYYFLLAEAGVRFPKCDQRINAWKAARDRVDASFIYVLLASINGRVNESTHNMFMRPFLEDRRIKSNCLGLPVATVLSEARVANSLIWDYSRSNIRDALRVCGIEWETNKAEHELSDSAYRKIAEGLPDVMSVNTSELWNCIDHSLWRTPWAG